MRKKELTSREWHLYKTLKEKAVGKENAMSSKQIIKELIGYTSSEDIRVGIANIKNSSVINRIICANGRGYYLAATEEEAVDYIQRDRKRYLKGLKANYSQVRKLRLHDQKRIQFGKYEREFIRSISDDLI